MQGLPRCTKARLTREQTPTTFDSKTYTRTKKDQSRVLSPSGARCAVQALLGTYFARVHKTLFGKCCRNVILTLDIVENIVIQNRYKNNGTNQTLSFKFAVYSKLTKLIYWNLQFQSSKVKAPETLSTKQNNLYK